MDYKTSKVNFVPNSQTIIVSKASSSSRALEEFRFDEELSLAIKVNRVEAWEVTPGQETESASSAA